MPRHNDEAVSARYAYYDRDADLAWLGTGDSEDVLSEEVNWGPGWRGAAHACILGRSRTDRRSNGID